MWVLRMKYSSKYRMYQHEEQMFEYHTDLDPITVLIQLINYNGCIKMYFIGQNL